jgi:hypothetical protein
MRLFIIQSTKSKGMLGRFLKLLAIDLYVLGTSSRPSLSLSRPPSRRLIAAEPLLPPLPRTGAVMFVLTNAVYIVGTERVSEGDVTSNSFVCE